MTKGSIVRAILGFAVPVYFGLLFQQLYNLADTVIVGRMLGVNALAGVGSTTGLSFLVLSIGNGLGNGFAVAVSQRFGANDVRGIKRYFGNGILLTVILSVLLAAVSLALLRPVLFLTNTPDDIYSFAHDYIFIIFLGLPCTALYNLLAANFRAIGDSKTPVAALVISSIVNIVLDIVFIGTFHLGVSGAAIATVLAQMLAFVFLFIRIMHWTKILRIQFLDLKLGRSESAEQLKTALPMMLEGMVIAIGILIVQAAVNSMGTVYVAGCTAGNKLYGIMAAPFEAICQAMIPVAGQNFGARQYARIDEGLKCVLKIGWLLMAVQLLIAWLFGTMMIRLFIDSAEADVISYGHQFMIYYVLGYGFLTIQMGFCYAMQGSGFAKQTILAGVLETCGRIFGSVVLTKWLGYTGVCLALPLAWLFTSAYVIPMYRSCRRKMGGKPVEKVTAE